jgi:proteasome accessory factor B
MDQTERLLDLLGLFLEARKPVTFEEIRATLTDAYTQGDVDTAKRMFERDKDALRDLGIPIETTSLDPWSDDANAYRLDRDRYYLPEIEFTPEEAAALCVAATAAGGSDDAMRALRKLLYGTDAAALLGGGDPVLAGASDLAGPQAAALADAIAERRRVRFAYRTPSGALSERSVHPWSLVWRSGHYYLVGLDEDREDVRCFRVSRFASDVDLGAEAQAPPEGFVGREHVAIGAGADDGPPVPVRIAFRPHVAWWALKGAEDVHPAGGEEGWEVYVIPGSTEDAFVRWVLSFGEDAQVLEPQEVRAAVRTRVEECLA